MALIPLRIIDFCDSSMASTRSAPYNLYKWSYNLLHRYGWPKINGVTASKIHSHPSQCKNPPPASNLFV